MLITTPEELQQYLPSHTMENISSMSGYFDNSEHDFLIERIGQPLHKFVSESYQEICTGPGTFCLLSENSLSYTPVQLLITLCQRVIVYDAFARSADIRAVSVNASGFNDSSSDGYDTSSMESVKAFKAQCVKEAHAATNRLLVQLEDWAKEADAQPAEVSPQPEDPKADVRNIVELWKQSAYFYKTEGLLINTATALSEFLDIYESREKFIQLVPDLRYIQEVALSAEIGEDLLEDLTQKNLSGKGNKTEKKTIRLLQRAMALCLEDRNKMFKRENAHSESIQALKVARDYITAHPADFNETAMNTSPLAPPKRAESLNESKWKNNAKGNAMLVTHPIF